MIQSSKLIDLAKSTIISSVLDIINVNYSVIDPDGHYIAQNKSMKNAISKGLINAERIDKPSWEHCKKIMKDKQKEIKEEKFKDKYYLSLKQPLIDNGKCIGILIISFDITKQKQAEIAKQEFIMNMSHDLRTPLAGIIGISSMQARDGTVAQDRQYGQWIQGASEQLLELINSVIEATAAEHQIESIKNESIHFQQFAGELQALMQAAVVAKGLEFQIILDKRLPIVLSDQIKLKRLLLNLLSNAVKFTKEGKISLEIDLLSIEEDRAKIEIRVTDTGIGIEKDKINKIFERFYRAHPSYEAEYTGYGVGLYLVKKTIELLDGEIKVFSEERKGSCFTLEFIFPLAEANTEQTVCPTLQSSYLKSHSEIDKQSVLVAEDNTLVLHVIKNLLVNLGYGVTTITDGNAALHALRTQYFHWALLDIGLPNLVGTEVAKRYRQWEKEHNKPRLPLFALTAHAIDEVKEKCEEVGIEYIFNKPFTNKDVQIIKLFMENKKSS